MKIDDKTIQRIQNFLINYNQKFLYKSVLMNKTGINTKLAQKVLSILVSHNQLKVLFTIRIMNVELDPETTYYNIQDIPNVVYSIDGEEFSVEPSNIFVFYEVVN